MTDPHVPAQQPASPPPYGYSVPPPGPHYPPYPPEQYPQYSAGQYPPPPPGHNGQGPYGTGQFVPSGPPREASPDEQRLWSTLTHIGMLVIGFWVPLITYLLLRDRGPFVRAHTATALNFEITWLIGYIGCFIVMFGSIFALAFPVIIVGYLAIVALLIMRLVFGIMAAVAAHKGRWYRYPMTIQFVK